MSASTKVHVFDDFELDEELRELRHRGRPRQLRRRPLELLLHLVHNRHRVVSKAELLDALWPGVVVSESALLSAMRDLRRALRDSGRDQDVIRTHHGFGYRFVAPVERPCRAERPDAAEADARLALSDLAPRLLAEYGSPGDDRWTEAFAHRLAGFIRRELETARASGALPPADAREARGDRAAAA